jgi:uncharacterized membrane protein YecN with MAPEG domain
MAAVQLVTVLVVLQFFFFAILVGRARQRYGVMAPAVTGNETFERYLRVQMNTLELLIMLLPALWIATAFVPPWWSALLGAVYLIGRFIYLRAYISDPARRGPGFGLSVLPILVLLAIALVGSTSRLLRGL